MKNRILLLSIPAILALAGCRTITPPASTPAPSTEEPPISTVPPSSEPDSSSEEPEYIPTYEEEKAAADALLGPQLETLAATRRVLVTQPYDREQSISYYGDEGVTVWGYRVYLGESSSGYPSSGYEIGYSYAPSDKGVLLFESKVNEFYKEELDPMDEYEYSYSGICAPASSEADALGLIYSKYAPLPSFGLDDLEFHYAPRNRSYFIYETEAESVKQAILFWKGLSATGTTVDQIGTVYVSVDRELGTITLDTSLSTAAGAFGGNFVFTLNKIGTNEAPNFAAAVSSAKSSGPLRSNGWFESDITNFELLGVDIPFPSEHTQGLVAIQRDYTEWRRWGTDYDYSSSIGLYYRLVFMDTGDLTSYYTNYFETAYTAEGRSYALESFTDQFNETHDRLCMTREVDRNIVSQNEEQNSFYEVVYTDPETGDQTWDYVPYKRMVTQYEIRKLTFYVVFDYVSPDDLGEAASIYPQGIFYLDVRQKYTGYSDGYDRENIWDYGEWEKVE